MELLNLLNTNEDLTNHCSFHNCFSDDEIETIKSISKNYEMVDGITGNKTNLSYRKSKVTWLPFNTDTEFIYFKIINFVKAVNDKKWKFNISNLKDKLQLAEYNGDESKEEQGHYDFHMDIGNSNMSTRKISVSIQLTDENDYEGGDLEIMTCREVVKAPREKGTIILFPSYFVHRVTNVTKGQRQSLVLWIHGAPFT